MARRFRRSVRIDTDISDPAALEGFVCPPSSASVLRAMAQHVSDSGQAAFTWTGPYGMGKSSLVVALSAALNGNATLRRRAVDVLGQETTDTLWDALPPKANGWRVLPVVGTRGRPSQVIGKAIERSRLARNGRIGDWSDEAVLDSLTGIAGRAPGKSGGLMVFIDEMGKFLEGAAYDGTDIYFFQQLAEAASRSDNRLIVAGILHQAFEEYAYRLSRELRDEWAKIQGRFVDLAVSVGPDEQLELLGRAIEVDREYDRPSRLSEEVAALSHRSLSPRLLEDCWPLHPITACLLGPISRRRFGQNQRSIFSFLTSMEPGGFQDFLRNARGNELYAPESLWDYLRVNLEPSIMASPDGHRWATVVDAVERCHTAGGDDLQIRLLKVVGLVDLFKERSGLAARPELLNLAAADFNPREVRAALDWLLRGSLVTFRKYSGSYSVFEGSDFDVDQAVEEAYAAIDEIDFERLANLAGLQPMIAKRHYHETGAIRWFDTSVAMLGDLENELPGYVHGNGSIGAFVLALPSQGDSPEAVARVAERLVRLLPDSVFVGIPQRTTRTIDSLARELLALEQVREKAPELSGDRVARLEVEARIADLQSHVESELRLALDSATWYGRGSDPRRLDHAGMNALASDVADALFDKSPRLHNELLNRIRPSSNAVAARSVLLRHMALYEGRNRLGIKGFPAEGGMFASLLEATGLYRETSARRSFVTPTPGDDPCNLLPAWEAATRFLESHSDRVVPMADIYDLWRAPPFGIKDGLLPVLAVAFALSKSDSVALYREGVFQVGMTDLDTDYLTRDPADIQLRWMDMSAVSRGLLAEMADVVREMDPDNALPNLEPIDVARGLVKVYDEFHPWVGRTQRLSGSAKRVRDMFKRADDPNRLIFDDIPEELDDGRSPYEARNVVRISGNLRKALSELRQAYPAMLNRLREMLLSELEVPNTSPAMLEDLRGRAKNIAGVSGDHRLEAFVVRMARFHGVDEDIESLASMATNKLTHSWVDGDVDSASMELADLARSFLRTEAFAHVKGRPSRRHAMAVVVGKGGASSSVHDSFEIGDLERAEVDALMERLTRSLEDSGESRRNVILAALAELSARYLDVDRSDTQGSSRARSVRP